MFVDANIVRERKEAAIVVPLYSVITRGDEAFCYVAEEGKARRRSVRTGIIKGLSVEIVSGVEAGDTLIVGGHRQVEDGQDIRIMRTITGPDELLNPKLLLR
jgi:membrane fusion protein (multidrug efflux system)